MLPKCNYVIADYGLLLRPNISYLVPWCVGDVLQACFEGLFLVEACNHASNPFGQGRVGWRNAIA